MTESECLKVWRPNLRASCPPNVYYDPYSGSQILSKDCIIDDFPAPVLPTIPTFYPFKTLKLTPLSTKGNSFLYFIWKSLKIISFPIILLFY